MCRAYSPRLKQSSGFRLHKKPLGNILGNLILIVDDDEADQFMLERTLRGIGVVNPVRKLSDGTSAIRYLNGDPPYHDRTVHPLPCVIFLDLKMPGVTGWDVLDWVHALSMKRTSKLFVHSSVTAIPDLQRMYTLGADSFISKPLKEVDLFNLVHHHPGPWEIHPPQDRTAPS
jgi:CheY-like chemotaxis protein